MIIILIDWIYYYNCCKIDKFILLPQISIGSYERYPFFISSGTYCWSMDPLYLSPWFIILCNRKWFLSNSSIHCPEFLNSAPCSTFLAFYTVRRDSKKTIALPVGLPENYSKCTSDSLTIPKPLKKATTYALVARKGRPLINIALSLLNSVITLCNNIVFLTCKYGCIILSFSSNSSIYRSRPSKFFLFNSVFAFYAIVDELNIVSILPVFLPFTVSWIIDYWVKFW